MYIHKVVMAVCVPIAREERGYMTKAHYAVSSGYHKQQGDMSEGWGGEAERRKGKKKRL